MKHKSDHFKYRVLFKYYDRYIAPNELALPSGRAFFILGSGRNGSTLLASLLNNHPDIFIPPEQPSLPYQYMVWQRNPVVPKTKRIRKLLKGLVHRSDWKMQTTRYFSKELSMDDVDSGFGEIIDRIYRIYGENVKGHIFKLWGDKTPLTIHFIEHIYSIFSKQKFIFLVRNPLDVYASFKKIYFHPASNIDFFCWKWNNAVDKFNFLRDKTETLKTVRYENLVSEPELAVNEIIQFLALSPEPDILQMERDLDVLAVNERDHHTNLLRSISDRSVGKWKDSLSDHEQLHISEKCMNGMEQFGYFSK